MTDESTGVTDDIRQGCFGSLILLLGLLGGLGVLVYQIIRV
ncbi:MAG: hypothetical protein ACD_30C00091G0003 [uncultured bacterium]|uniref:Uncharacterized protein n=2 Tax=Candidatus Daviesiibacteriota TaxID=1752718 RepID=A0A0G0ESZ2_9BACT|nr:MAG: hypothetical protein ACD_30C00091G0003 [uncultured bacterium]KKQ10013.1 MAG: hypothetical protein US19_C0009G0015 [Candidatus Daviesbacteria bacterium GW2011_GWB1_36_5]KKQ14702.1 MAG: hypothetical protein US28_C0032G0004 [Candidatus Daviesbacteria bacterium GW2011_GWA1_36_8]